LAPRLAGCRRESQTRYFPYRSEFLQHLVSFSFLW
jgi:hypothetical protein